MSLAKTLQCRWTPAVNHTADLTHEMKTQAKSRLMHELQCNESRMRLRAKTLSDDIGGPGHIAATTDNAAQYLFHWNSIGQ
jgi:hypothetical protein